MTDRAPLVPEDLTHALRELVAAGRFRDAVALYERAAKTTSGAAADVQLLVATAAARVGNDSLGETLAMTALESFQARADEDGHMRAVNLLGAINWKRGYLDDAERCFSDALGLAQRLRDALLAARASQNLALVSYLRGRHDVALSLFRTALLEYQRLGDRRHAAETYHNLGDVFRLLEVWDEAESAVLEAVRHAELVGDPALLAFVLIGRAEVALARGELDVAQIALERASRQAHEAGDATALVEAQRVVATLLIRRGDYQRARTTAESAYAAAQSIENAVLRADCAATLSLAWRALHDTARAAELRSEALRGYAAIGAAAFRDRFEKDWARSESA